MSHTQASSPAQGASIVPAAVLQQVQQQYRRSILQVATCHIPLHTAQALGLARAECEKAPLWNVLPYEPWGECGWIIWCNGSAQEKEHEVTGDPTEHLELFALLRLADGLGFDYLQLDEAGRTLPAELAFKEFTW